MEGFMRPSSTYKHFVLLALMALTGTLIAPGDAMAQNIRGFVFAEDAGGPLEGVLVRLLTRELDELETTTTDLLGRFSFQASGPERYVVVTELADYASAPQVVEVGPIRLATVEVIVAMTAMTTATAEATGDARTAHLRGQIVVAGSEDPVEAAEITLESDGRRVLTRWDGRFVIGDLPPGTHRIVIDHIGFAGRTWAFEADPGSAYDVRIPVEEEAIPLEGIQVTVRSRAVARKLEPVFNRMERSMGGYFQTAVDFKQRGYPPIGMMLRTLPSVEVLGTGMASTVRMRRGGSQFQPGCSPEIWVDGIRLARSGYEAGEFLAQNTLDIEIIEVFPSASSIPPDYNTSSLCAIGIWTKRGG